MLVKISRVSGEQEAWSRVPYKENCEIGVPLKGNLPLCVGHLCVELHFEAGGRRGLNPPAGIHGAVNILKY